MGGPFIEGNLHHALRCYSHPMRLKIKEPEIEIGKDGFAQHCKLDRAPYGKKLSDLVENLGTPLAYADQTTHRSGTNIPSRRTP